MRIADWQKESFIDYPGKISTIVFTSGCNYDCAYCHNPEFKKKGKGKISEAEFFGYIDSRREWIDGVVISGGEPLLYHSLPYFIREIKKRGLAVKLDTNGSNHSALKEINKEGLVDYVAMDVKGPIYLYPKIIGKEFIDEREDIGKAIEVVMGFPDCEFRTTVMPIERENGAISFMAPKEIRDTAKLIYEWTGVRKHKYFLQPFKAIEKKEGNKIFLKKNLSKEFWETPKEHLEKCLIEARKYLPNCDVR